MQHYVGGRCSGPGLKVFRMREAGKGNATEGVFCCVSVEAHQGRMSRLSRLLVRNADVLHG